jgi:dihydrolipoamide dehydrogenase
MLGKSDPMCYDFIPEVIYTSPEAASVGLTQAQAMEKGLAVRVIKLPMSYSGRYVAEGGAPNGICKMVVDLRRQGARVSRIAPYASEIIAALQRARAEKDRRHAREGGIPRIDRRRGHREACP